MVSALFWVSHLHHIVIYGNVTKQANVTDLSPTHAVIALHILKWMLGHQYEKKLLQFLHIGWFKVEMASARVFPHHPSGIVPIQGQFIE